MSYKVTIERNQGTSLSPNFIVLHSWSFALLDDAYEFSIGHFHGDFKDGDTVFIVDPFNSVALVQQYQVGKWISRKVRSISVGSVREEVNT